MQETSIWFLGWEDPLEKGKATHSSILAWRIPWTIQTSIQCRQESDKTERLSLSLSAPFSSFSFLFLHCVLSLKPLSSRGHVSPPILALWRKSALPLTQGRAIPHLPTTLTPPTKLPRGSVMNGKGNRRGEREGDGRAEERGMKKRREVVGGEGVGARMADPQTLI